MKCKQCVANNKALTIIKQKCEDLTEQILDENRDPLDRAGSATQAVLYVEWLATNINMDKPIKSFPKQTIIALTDIYTTITNTKVITKDKEYEVVKEKHNGVSVKSDYYNHDGTIWFLFNSQYDEIEISTECQEINFKIPSTHETHYNPNY